jgi:hypothetical protein
VRSGDTTALGVEHAQRQRFEPVGAWPEHNLLGTQLGPNKNGRKW